MIKVTINSATTRFADNKVESVEVSASVRGTVLRSGSVSLSMTGAEYEQAGTGKKLEEHIKTKLIEELQNEDEENAE